MWSGLKTDSTSLPLADSGIVTRKPDFSAAIIYRVSVFCLRKHITKTFCVYFAYDVPSDETQC